MMLYCWGMGNGVMVLKFISVVEELTTQETSFHRLTKVGVSILPMLVKIIFAFKLTPAIFNVANEHFDLNHSLYSSEVTFKSFLH